MSGACWALVGRRRGEGTRWISINLNQSVSNLLEMLELDPFVKLFLTSTNITCTWQFHHDDDNYLARKMIIEIMLRWLAIPAMPHPVALAGAVVVRGEVDLENYYHCYKLL